MDVAAASSDLLALVEQHRALAGPIFAAFAFGESLVVVGVLVPATGLMIAAGALVGAGTLSFVDVWIGGALGAALGDTVSFWVGRRLGPHVHRLWPFSRHPEMLEAARRAFARWGWAAVFVGRFIGPLRASVPTVAGMSDMRVGLFQAANVGSAIVWIPVLIAPGSLGAWAWSLFGEGRTTTAVLVAAALLAGVVAALVLWRRVLPRRLRQGDASRPPDP
jgi:membrane protein DedA with SNARE-associated domain